MANELCSQPTYNVLYACMMRDNFFPSGSYNLLNSGGTISLWFRGSSSVPGEFELCVRTEESWPLSWAAKSRWAGRSLKMCFACLVTLKAISCHSYSVHWQRRIAPWQIVLATGPYMYWTLKLAPGLYVCVCVHSSEVQFVSLPCRAEIYSNW